MRALFQAVNSCPFSRVLIKIRKLTWESLHQHGETLARHVQLGSSLHNSDNVGDDGILLVLDAAVEANNADHRRGIAFEMHHVVGWILQQVERDDFALVVLEAAVTPHVLQADTHVRQFPVQTPSVAVVHGHDVRLAEREFAENDHARSRGVDRCALVEDLGGGLGFADPDGRVASDPVRDHGGLVLLGEGFEIHPWLDVGELERVADDWPWERTGRLKRYM